MSRIVDKILTQNNNNNKNKNNSYTYVLIVVDELNQLSQLRYAK